MDRFPFPKSKDKEQSPGDPSSLASEHEKAACAFRISQCQSAGEVFQLLKEDENPLVRQAAVAKLMNPGDGIREIIETRPKDLLDVFKREDHEWVYYVLYSAIKWDLYHGTNKSFLNDGLLALSEVAVVHKSEVRRCNALYWIIETRRERRDGTDWVDDFARDRVLSDESNWVRAVAADQIVKFDGHSDSLVQFAAQWFRHTKFAPLTYKAYPKKIDDYFASDRRPLLAPDTPVSKDAGPLKLRPSWRAQWAPISGGVFLVLLAVFAGGTTSDISSFIVGGLLLLSFGLFAVAIVRRFRCSYEVNAKNIIVKTGLFGQLKDPIEIAKINRIPVKQALIMPKLLNYGDVDVWADEEKSRLTLHNVSNPQRISLVIEEFRARKAVPAPPETASWANSEHPDRPPAHRESTTKSATDKAPLDVAKVFEREFHPEHGRFPHTSLRPRIYEAVSQKAKAGDVHGALWRALLTPEFTAQEREDVFKHFMTAVAAEQALG